MKNSSRPPTVGRLLANRLPTGYQQITDSLPTDYRQLTNRLPTVGNLKKQGEKTLRNLAINLSSLYILTKLKREATLARSPTRTFSLFESPYNPLRGMWTVGQGNDKPKLTYKEILTIIFLILTLMTLQSML